jgi:hypothetical protein
MCLPPGQQVSKPIASEFKVVLGGPSCLLSKRVQHIDAFGERGHVEHAMFAFDVNPNLANTRTDRGHRLPVVRLKALLNAAKLESRSLSGLRRKRTEFLERRSEPD